MKYLIVLEQTSTGFSAYAPDLDGCVAAGDDRDETVALMREAIAFHLEGLAMAGEPIPSPSCESAYVDISDSPNAWSKLAKNARDQWARENPY